jgi:glycosyltransferase involved in cell wall biosynthesis
MIKVLVINTLAIDYNGVTDCILQYLKAMDKKNMQIDILSTVSLNSELEKKFLRLGCTIIQLENRKQNPIMYVWKLAGLVRREKYNIVHAHGNSATLTFDMLGAFLGKCKVRIAHGHSTQCGSKLVDMLLRPFFYKLYTCGISCGKDVGDWLFKRHKFQILPNGRELSLYKYNVKNRQEIRVKYNLGNSLVIGHIGRFNKPKNQEFVLEIFMELQKLQKNAKLLLVGDGILFGNIQNCARNKGIAEHVVFTGSIGNIPEILSAMDVMVLPSLYEGMPLVVLEWQASGLPCIISDSITRECKVTDLVEFLPLSIGAKEWAQEIIRVEEQKKDRKYFDTENMMKEAGFDIKENAKELRKLYEKLYQESWKVNGML